MLPLLPLLLLFSCSLIFSIPTQSFPTNNTLLTESILNHLLYLPTYKFIFCRIEKVANTAISAILHKIPRHDNITQQSSIYNHHSITHYNIPLHTLSEYISDPTWTKAMFYREPLSRFLSAYRSKCEHFDKDGKIICRKSFGANFVSFEVAVKGLFKRILPSCDVHFAPQSTFCGSLSKSIQYYTYAIELNQSRLRDDTIRILDVVNITSSQDVKDEIDIQLPSIGGSNTSSSNVNKSNSSSIFHNTNHTTHASDTNVLLHYYTEPCYIKLVVEYYRNDYQTFNISYPTWAQSVIETTSLTHCLDKFRIVINPYVALFLSTNRSIDTSTNSTSFCSFNRRKSNKNSTL
jgi:Sulfotransferase family